MREDAYYKDESRLRSGGYMSRGGANCVGQMRGRNLSGEIRTIKDALEDFRIQKQSQISTVPSFDNESFPALERLVLKTLKQCFKIHLKKVLSQFQNPL